MQNKYYDLKLEDFKRAFQFGADYYIDPNKITTGRTTGEPRGLGSILDAFTLGKLTEIGVEKALTLENPNKRYLLDFSIKSINNVKDEPDIIAVYENNSKRAPACFVEIKNTSERDRWIGLTEEQFNTIKRSAGNKPIYFIYASIHSDMLDNNPKTTDLTGMFLKKIENTSISTIFQKFANLNAKCKIEFIISSDDLEQYSFTFERGMNMYETNLFKEKRKDTIYKSNRDTRKDVLKSKIYNNFNSIIELKTSKGIKENKSKISKFNVSGSFILHYKKNTTYIECKSDVIIVNDVFGKFLLKKNKYYGFNLETIGRDPTLKRNNLFISKRRAYQLVENKQLRNFAEVIKEIAYTI